MKTNVTLESLNLSDNDILDSGAELIGDFLKTNTGLKILYLSSCLIEHEGERHLGEALRVNSVLTSLDLWSNPFGSSRTIANALLSNTTLIDLNMEDTECGDLGAIAFASALTMNTTLKSLSPQSNDIRFRGARALAVALKRNVGLTHMDLIDNDGFSDVGLRLLCASLEVKRNLAALHVGNVGTRHSAGGRAIANLLKRNKALTTLAVHLEFGYGRSPSCVPFIITDALSTNTVLTTLNLGGQNTSAAAAVRIAQALKMEGNALKYLHLKHACIGDEGASAIGHALESNTTLVLLGIGGNKIGVQGALTIGECLACNSSLITLNLSENSIGMQGVCAIAEALKLNRTLQHLEMHHCVLSTDGIAVVADA